jgi:hypothetical protein
MRPLGFKNGFVLKNDRQLVKKQTFLENICMDFSKQEATTSKIYLMAARKFFVLIRLFEANFAKSAERGQLLKEI